VSVAAFIACQRTEYGVQHAVSCRALGLSESWFYKWRDRPPTRRQVRRVELADKIREFFEASGGTYGSGATVTTSSSPPPPPSAAGSPSPWTRSAAIPTSRIFSRAWPSAYPSPFGS
jgi:hypothetical protein